MTICGHGKEIDFLFRSKKVVGSCFLVEFAWDASGIGKMGLSLEIFWMPQTR